MKKIIKTFLLVVGLTPLVVLLVSALAYRFYGMLALGGESTPHQQYLKRNQQLVIGGKASDFTLFDESFYQNQIFLLAEAHGFEQPQTLDLSLLKHLHQRVGIKYYLAEVDYCQAQFLNQYLQTGREALLRSVFQFWIERNYQWANRQFYDKIKKIRVYNLTLPEKNRIQFLGVDRLQDLALTKRFLKLLLRDRFYRSAKEPLVDSLHRVVSATAPNEQKLADVAERFLATRSEGQGQEIVLSHVLRNLVYHHRKASRDSVMYQNLKDLTRTLQLGQEKFYGLWGFTHTLPGTINGGNKPFAAYLRQADSPFRGIVAMNIYPLDSENMLPGKMFPSWISKGKAYVNSTWANNDGPLVFVSGIRDLKAVTSENTTALFKLSGEESPYWHSSRLAQTKVIIPGQSIEADEKNPRIPDAFPYVFLMRNSKALQPL